MSVQISSILKIKKFVRNFCGFGTELEIIPTYCTEVSVYPKECNYHFFLTDTEGTNLIIVICEKKGGRIL